MYQCMQLCSYADDTNFHVCDSDFKDLIPRLEHEPLLATELFQTDCRKLDEVKFNFLKSRHKHELFRATIRRSKI